MVKILEEKGINCADEFNELVEVLQIGEEDQKLREHCNEIIEFFEGLTCEKGGGDASVINALGAVKTAISTVLNMSLNINSNNITIPHDASNETKKAAVEQYIENLKNVKSININSNNLVVQDSVKNPEPEPKNSIPEVGPSGIHEGYDKIFNLIDNLSGSFPTK